jgi:hypothetical protein
MSPRKKKIEFGNWGAPKNWPRKWQHRFKHVVIIATTAAFVIVLFLVFVFGLELVRQAIQHFIQNALISHLQSIPQPVAPATEPVPATSTAIPVVPKPAPAAEATIPTNQATSTANQSPQINPTWLPVTFYAGFGGVGWLNIDKTTMYRDNSETAFILPPQYNWVPSSPQTFAAPEVPRGITTKVVQDNGLYKVLVYAPDGSIILSATSTPIVSPYPGTVGIGGTLDDFLVVYGGYQGAGARIQSANGTWQVQDLSSLFQIRAMNGGFIPKIISVKNHTLGTTTYYIYSDTPNNPKLIKLYPDPAGNIAGVVDYSSLVLPKGTQSAIFSVGSSDNQSGSPTTVTLIAKIADEAGAVSYWSFIDDGFETDKAVAVVSSNINTYPWSVAQATLKNVSISGAAAEEQFYLSQDGEHWQSVVPGGTVYFPANDGNGLYWKAVFTPLGDNLTSPFFRSLEIDYWTRRPSF